MDDNPIKILAENLLKEDSSEKDVEELKVLLNKCDSKSELEEVLSSLLSSVVSSIGSSNSATRTALLVLKYVLQNEVQANEVEIHKMLNKLFQQLPTFQNNAVDFFKQATDCFESISNDTFEKICSDNNECFTTILNNFTAESSTNIDVLKLCFKLVKSSESGRSIVVENIKTNNFLPEIITLLLSGDKLCRKIIIDIIFAVTSPSISFTTVTTVHIQHLKENLLKYVTNLKNFLKSNEEDWHLIWCCVLRLFGLALDSQGPSDANALLGVLETAFKSSSTTTRISAFQCWQELIFNFALNLDELCTKKRMKLLLIPLKANNCKVDLVALEKFKTWWLLITKISARIHLFTDVALIPFINFCFLSKTPLTTSVTDGVVNKREDYLCKHFPMLIPYTIDALLQLIGHKNDDCGCISIIKERTTAPLISERIFNALGAHIIASVKEASFLLNDDSLDINRHLILQCMWSSLFKNIGCQPKDETIKTAYSNMMLVLSHFLSTNSNDLISIIVKEIALATDWMLNLESDELVHFIILNKIFLEKDFTFKNEFSDFIFFILRCSKLVDFIQDEDDLHCLWKNFRLHLPQVVTREDFQKIFIQYLTVPIQYLLQLKQDQLINLNKWSEFYTEILEQLVTMEIRHQDGSNEILVKFCLFLEEVSQNTNHTNLCFIANILNSSLNDLKVLSVPINCVEKIFHLLERLQEVQNENYNCLIFNSLNKLLKTFYVNPDALKVIIEQLAKFATHKTITLNRDDFLNTLKIMEDIITPIQDNNLINMICVCLKSFEKLNDKDINAQVCELIERCKNKLIKGTTKIVKMADAPPRATEKSKKTKVDLAKPTNRGAQMLAMSMSEKKTELFGHDLDTMKPILKRNSFFTRSSTPNKSNGGEEFVAIESKWKFDPKSMSEKQKEKIKERGKDIPALYEDLSQSNSQDLFNVSKSKFINKENSDQPETGKKLSPKNAMVINVSTVEPIILKRDTQNESTFTISPKRPIVKRRGRSVKRKVPYPHVTGDSDLSVYAISNEKKTVTVEATTTAEDPPNTEPSSEAESAPDNKNSSLVQSDSQISETLETVSENNQNLQNLTNGDHSISTPTVEVKSETNNDESMETKSKDIIESSLPAENKESGAIQISNADNCEKPIENEVENEPKTETLLTSDTSEPKKESDNIVTVTKSKRLPRISKAKLAKSNIIPESQPPPEMPSEINASTTVETTSTTDVVSLSDTQMSVESQSTKSELLPDSQQSLSESQSSDFNSQTEINAPPTPTITPKKKRGPKKGLITKTEREIRKLQINCNQLGGEMLNSRRLRSRQLSVDMIDTDVIKFLPKKESNAPAETPTKVKRRRKSESNIVDVISNSEEIIESSQESTVSKVRAKRVNQRPLKINRNKNKMLETSETPLVKDKNEDPPAISTTDNVVENNKDKIEDLSTSSDNIFDQSTEPIENDQEKEVKEGSKDVDNSMEVDTQPITDSFTADNEDLLPNMDSEVSSSNVSFGEYKAGDSVLATSLLSSPTRNVNSEQLTKEFLNSTNDISPIKAEVEQRVPEQADQLSDILQNDEQQMTTIEEVVNVSNKSPELLFSEELEKKRATSSEEEMSPETERKVVRSPSSAGKRRLHRARGRSAQLLELISNINETVIDETIDRVARNVSGNEASSSSDKKKKEPKNLLKFEKVLPSPQAKPSASIIKSNKRKHPCDPEDIESPRSKRKRVSFHDPPVSCEKQYVPEVETGKHSSKKSSKSLLSLFKNATRSAQINNSNVEINITRNREDNNSTSPTYVDEQTMLSELSSLPIESQGTPTSIDPQTLSNKGVFYSQLVECCDPIENIINELTLPMWEESLKQVLAERNIKTIGDFASITEVEMNRLPIKEHKINNTRTVLNNYCRKLQTINLETGISSADISPVNLRRQSLPAVLNRQVNNMDLKFVQQMFRSCSNKNEKSNFFNKILSIVGATEDIKLLINAINSRMDILAHLAEIDENFIINALKHVSMDRGINSLIQYVVSVMGNELAYETISSSLKDVTGIQSESTEASTDSEKQLLTLTIDLLNKRLAALTKIPTP